MILKPTNLSNVHVVKKVAYNVGTQCTDGVQMTEIKSEGGAWELLKDDTPFRVLVILAISIKPELIVLGAHLMLTNVRTNLALIASI